MRDLKFIDHVDIKKLVEYSKMLLLEPNTNFKVDQGLYSIMVYDTIYQGGHYDGLKYVKFDDFGYIRDNSFGRVDVLITNFDRESENYIRFVYENLPDELKCEYENACKEFYDKEKASQDVDKKIAQLTGNQSEVYFCK